jgi:hypothetical protein
LELVAILPLVNKKSNAIKELSTKSPNYGMLGSFTKGLRHFDTRVNKGGKIGSFGCLAVDLGSLNYGMCIAR